MREATITETVTGSPHPPAPGNRTVAWRGHAQLCQCGEVCQEPDVQCLEQVVGDISGEQSGPWSVLEPQTGHKADPGPPQRLPHTLQVPSLEARIEHPNERSGKGLGALPHSPSLPRARPPGVPVPHPLAQQCRPTWGLKHTRQPKGLQGPRCC